MAVSLDGPEDAGAAPEKVVLTLRPEQAGQRLDKALAEAAADLPGLSRSRLAQLVAGGAVRDPEGRTVTDARAKVKPGAWTLAVPPPAPSDLEPEAIPLDIAYEDEALIVINKPAGMVVHPAPGAGRGTLVAALIHHCGPGLTGIGDEARPGIVHRIDKDTSGLLVAAKTQAAHEGLSDLFAQRRVERRYLAVVWGAPDMADPRLAGLPGVAAEPGGVIRIDRPIARHPRDRKRMAVVVGGRRAVTRMRVLERYGAGARPLASLVECRLETGRTHQIRVHASHAGFPLVGDRIYGRARSLPDGVAAEARRALQGFPRQALHAANLGFRHPLAEMLVSCEAPLPEDMATLVSQLRRIRPAER